MTGAQYQHSSDWTDSDIALFVAMCVRLQCSPYDLAGCWMSESSLSSIARNPKDESKPPVAVGVQQWTRAGAPPGQDLEELRHWPIARQLVLAEVYYAPHRGRMLSPGAVYLVNWLPAIAAHGSDPTFVCAALRGPFAWAYRDNASLDANGDGRITVQDLTDKIRAAQKGPRWAEFAARLAAAIADRDTSPRLPDIIEETRDVPDTTWEEFPANTDGEEPPKGAA